MLSFFMDLENNQPIVNKTKKRRIIKVLSRVLLIFVLMSAAFASGMILAQKNEIIKSASVKEAVYAGKIYNKYVTAPANKLSQDVDFNLFWNVWDLLKEKYVDKDKLDDKTMFYGALKGLVDSAGDPLYCFMEPKLAKEFSNDLAGTFEGIGRRDRKKNDCHNYKSRPWLICRRKKPALNQAIKFMPSTARPLPACRLMKR